MSRGYGGTTRLNKLFPTLLQAKRYADKIRGLAGSDLVGLWMLNDTSGTVATDTSGRNINAVYNSVTLAQVAGPGPSMGLAPQFDGINDNVTFAAGPLAALNAAWSHEELTIGCWFKMDTVAHWNDGNSYCCLDLGVNSLNRFLLFKAGANLFQLRSTRGGTNTVRNATGLTSLAWLNFIMTVSAGLNQFRGYFQGAQLGTDQALGGTWSGSLSTSESQIGSLAGGSFAFGNIDGVFVAKRALTPTEVAQFAEAS